MNARKVEASVETQVAVDGTYQVAVNAYAFPNRTLRVIKGGFTDLRDAFDYNDEYCEKHPAQSGIFYYTEGGK